MTKQVWVVKEKKVEQPKETKKKEDAEEEFQLVSKGWKQKNKTPLSDPQGSNAFKV